MAQSTIDAQGEIGAGVEMAKVEGNFARGWTVYFSKSESQDIADALSVGSVAAGFIPEPVLSKIIAASGAILGIAAQRAVRKGKKLGVHVSLHRIPKSWPPSGWEVINFWIRGPFGPAYDPFVYTGKPWK